MIRRFFDDLTARPWLLSLLLAAAFLPLKLWGYTNAYLNIHAARDWERGWQLMHGAKLWLHGPELLFGGSVPGFFFYLLTGLTQIPHRNPELSAAIPPLLFCISIGFFHDTVRRLYSPRVALLATLVYGSFPFGTLTLRYLWNPTYLFVFGAFALWCVVRAAEGGRRMWVSLGLFALLLAGQIHLTAYLVAAAYVVLLLIERMRPGWRSLALVLVLQGAFLAPYYVDQVRNGWPDHAGLKGNAQRSDVNIARVAPNPNFLPVFGLQVMTQAPSPRIWPQTFPFSYYEQFYRDSGLGRRLGWIAFALSIPIALLMVPGLGSWLGDASPRRAAVRYAVLGLVAVSLPHVLWNPKLGGDPNVGVPARYFLAAWPCQFLLLAAGLNWAERSVRIRQATTALALASLVANLALTLQFHRTAERTGKPFQYLKFENVPVHTLRDKMELARTLVRDYGVTEDLFLTRVHSEPNLLVMPEESLDFEVRAAVESVRPKQAADPSLYYYIVDPSNVGRVRGQIHIVATHEFRALAVVVYRPRVPLTGWQNDPPVSWWWH